MKNYYIFLILLIAMVANSSSQSGAIIYETGDPTIDENAIFEIISQDKGVLIPRMNTLQRNSITTPPNSLLIFNTDLGFYQYYRELTLSWVSLIPGDLSVQGSGNIGEVAFWINGNSSNTISSDSNLYYDFDNAYLGIGTNSPTFTLDVYGTIRTGGNGQSGNLRLYSEQGANDFFVGFSPASNMTENTAYILPSNLGTNGQVLVTLGDGSLTWTNAPEIEAESVTINGTDGGVLYNNSGTLTPADYIVFDDINNYLGIGTASPGYPLQVEGVIFSGSSTNTGTFSISDGTGNQVRLTSSELTEDITFVLPGTTGNPGEFLQTDGNGSLTWANPLQDNDFVVDVATGDPTNSLAFYNGSNSINSASITYDPANGDLTIANNLLVEGSTTTTNLTASQSVTAQFGIFENLELDGEIIAQELLLSDDIFNTSIVSGSLTNSITFVLPGSTGNAGEFLQTDGTGSLTWADPLAGNDFVVDVATGDPTNRISFYAGSNSINSTGIEYDPNTEEVTFPGDVSINGSVTATSATFTDLESTDFTTDNLTATSGTIENLEVTNILTSGTIIANYGQFDNIELTGDATTE